VKTTEHLQWQVTVPTHSALRVGALAGILSDVAEHFDLSRDEVACLASDEVPSTVSATSIAPDACDRARDRGEHDRKHVRAKPGLTPVPCTLTP
jgi:hypothetical protein